MTVLEFLENYKDYPSKEGVESNFKLRFEMDYVAKGEREVRFFSDEILRFKTDFNSETGNTLLRAFIDSEGMSTFIVPLTNSELDTEMLKEEGIEKKFYTLETKTFSLCLGVVAPTKR